MTMAVNGAAVLAAIAKNPADFAMSHSQINTLAMATLITRFKDKTVGLHDLRGIARTIGNADFRLALDHLAGKDVAAINKRLDSKHPDLKTASETWHREHIAKLAEGIVEPMVAAGRTPAKKAAAAKDPGSKTGPVMKSKALKPKPGPTTRQRSTAKKA